MSVDIIIDRNMAHKHQQLINRVCQFLEMIEKIWYLRWNMQYKLIKHFNFTYRSAHVYAALCNQDDASMANDLLLNCLILCRIFGLFRCCGCCCWLFELAWCVGGGTRRGWRFFNSPAIPMIAHLGLRWLDCGGI